MFIIDSRMGQETWVGVCTTTHAHAQWNNFCAINLFYHRLELCTSTSKNIESRSDLCFTMTRYTCGNDKRVCQLTKHIFGLKHCF